LSGLPQKRSWPASAAVEKKPLERGFGLVLKELLLDASWVFFVFFFGAIDFFVVHFAAAVRTCEGGHGHQHESGNECSHHEFHTNTLEQRGW
jgi:hypothetical protein